MPIARLENPGFPHWGFPLRKPSSGGGDHEVLRQ